MKKAMIIMPALLCVGIASKATALEIDSTTIKKDSIMTKKDSTMGRFKALESIANGVKDGYLLIENGVVKGYKAIETGAVNGFTMVNDAITLKLFGKDGETIAETKARLNSVVEASQERNKEILEKNMKATKDRTEKANPRL